MSKEAVKRSPMPTQPNATMQPGQSTPPIPWTKVTTILCKSEQEYDEWRHMVRSYQLTHPHDWVPPVLVKQWLKRSLKT